MAHDFKLRLPTEEETAAKIASGTHAENALPACLFDQVQTGVREARKLARKGSGHLAIEGLCDMMLSGIALAQQGMSGNEKG